MADERRYFTLAAVARRIQHYLAPAQGRTFWVSAEVKGGRERGGAFFCDLVESGATGDIVAQLSCTIWARDLERIRAKFARAGLTLTLDEGTRIGLECRVQYHPRFGLSLSGLDMDPAFALGELELRRRRILERLLRGGLLERNAERTVPLLPNRVVLITARDSAAERDFTDTVARSGFGIRVYRADCRMQGEQAEPTILAALRAAEGLPADLVVIARGGGSRTELGWLDNEVIARRIAAHPLPVWTAIGHHTDTSVLDQVAARAFGTPATVAEELVARFENLETQLGSAGSRLRAVWALRRDAEARLLGHARTGIQQGTRKLLETRRAELERTSLLLRARVSERLAAQRGGAARLRQALRSAADARLRHEDARLRERRGLLGVNARNALARARADSAPRRARLARGRVLRRIEEERRRLSAGTRALRASDPATALARGFSLTYVAGGRLVRSVGDLEVGQATLTRFVDGNAESTVRKLQEESDG